MPISKFHLEVTINSDDKKFIREQLQELLKSLDTPYGKPCQGNYSHHNGEINITTKIWNGQRY